MWNEGGGSLLLFFLPSFMSSLPSHRYCDMRAYTRLCSVIVYSMALAFCRVTLVSHPPCHSKREWVGFDARGALTRLHARERETQREQHINKHRHAHVDQYLYNTRSSKVLYPYTDKVIPNRYVGVLCTYFYLCVSVCIYTHINYHINIYTYIHTYVCLLYLLM